MKSPPVLRFCAGIGFLLLALSGCDNMQHQENVRPFEASAHFPDGASARTPPVHTIAREDPAPDDPWATGGRPGAWSVDFPASLTRELLVRGQDRFTIFCADCHGADGDGQGIIVRRGFPPPLSFHDARLRQAPVGSLFDAITHGFGKMYGFSDRIEPRDRWAIVAYVRALQKSRNSTIAELSPEDRRHLPP